MKKVIVKGGFGGRIEVAKGEILEVLNVEGQQIADFFAFNKSDLTETLSPSAIRLKLRRIVLKVGDVLVSSKINPMFELLEDTCGIHDFTWPSCDPVVYAQRLGPDNHHRNCRTNLAEAVAGLGIPYVHLPEPVNLFQNTPILADGTIVTHTSPAKAGDKVVLRALQDLYAAVSACPSETGMNGDRSTDIHLIVR